MGREPVSLDSSYLVCVYMSRPPLGVLRHCHALGPVAACHYFIAGDTQSLGVRNFRKDLSPQAHLTRVGGPLRHWPGHWLTEPTESQLMVARIFKWNSVALCTHTHTHRPT